MLWNRHPEAILRVILSVPDSLGAQIDDAALEDERSRSGQIAYYVRAGMRASGLEPSPERIRRRLPSPALDDPREPHQSHAPNRAPDTGDASPERAP